MIEALLSPVDIYCERLGAGFWAEPLNALTNLAFVLAGLLGLAAVRRRGGDRFSIVLCWWVVAIGIGSGLFHTFANGLTMWADIIPIAAFTVAYTLFNLRRFLGLGWAATIVGTAAFYIAAGAVTAAVPQHLQELSNNSTGYLPAFLALVFFGLLLIATGRCAGWYNLAAAAIFIASVSFRAADPLVCAAFALGSHFMWHLLNALLLGVLLAAVARYGRRLPSPQGRG